MIIKHVSSSGSRTPTDVPTQKHLPQFHSNVTTKSRHFVSGHQTQRQAKDNMKERN